MVTDNSELVEDKVDSVTTVVVTATSPTCVLLPELVVLPNTESPKFASTVSKPVTGPMSAREFTSSSLCSVFPR